MMKKTYNSIKVILESQNGVLSNMDAMNSYNLQVNSEEAKQYYTYNSKMSSLI